MSLRQHIASQFPSLFITLVSILIGIFFADLVSEAQARMTLWPLDVHSLRIWGQIAGMGASALTVCDLHPCRHRAPRNPLGHLGVLYGGVPFYAAAGWAAARPAIAAGGPAPRLHGPAGRLPLHLAVFRDGHAAVAAAEKDNSAGISI